jgi:quinol-cytochrome oxidoreductase complex cytochrome b subunit
MHTFVLPLAAVLMLTHFLMIRKQGISGPFKLKNNIKLNKLYYVSNKNQI